MPDFLTLDDVLEVHKDQIERYGGDGGLRDLGLLQSALATPQATFDAQYLHATVFEMAAAYFFHIAKDHPFLDGNKRTATASAIIFLELNDIEVEQKCESELADVVLSLVDGKIGKTEIAEFLRVNSKA